MFSLHWLGLWDKGHMQNQLILWWSQGRVRESWLGPANFFFIVITTGQKLRDLISWFSNVAKLWYAGMKQKLRLFIIHQTATSLQQTDNLNPRIRWYPALDKSNRMKFAYFTIHLGKSPPQNGCQLNFIFFESTGFASSTFPIQLDFSQNQLATITLNTGSPLTLMYGPIFGHNQSKS